MPSLTVAEYLKFANLQMAAEALYNFDANKNSNLIPGQDATGLLTADNLTTGNRHASAFAPTQVTFSQLTDDWAVVEHKSNTTTGFSGTLFKRNGANEFVLSLRSTEFADDAARDNEATNLQEIKAKGWAFGQIADMEDWYAGLKSRITGSLSVTGYSLGGHLATAFNLLHPDAAQQVVTFNGAGIGAIAGANDLSSLSTQLTEMIAHFRSLRQQAASANGLIDAFHSEGGRQAYQALRAALAGKDGVPAAGMKALVDKYAPTKADEDILWQADRDLLIRQTLTGDGNGALIRALAVLDYAHYAPEQKSGSSDPTAPARAARVPDTYLDPVTKQQQLAIAGAGLDYQLAVLLTAEKYRTSALSLAGSIAAIAGTGTRGVATLPNQIDVAATEMDTNTPTFMVAHSQYRYGTEQRIFIENQPLTRGDVVSESIQASFKHFAIRALVDKYTINDFGDTHSLVLLIDTLNVQNTLANLLPPGQSTKTTLETLDAIFKTASYLKAESASGTQGKAEGDVIESVVNAMAAMFLPPDDATKVRLHGNPKGGTWADIKNGDKYTGRDALYASLTAIVGSAAYKALADAAKNGLVSLVPPTSPHRLRPVSRPLPPRPVRAPDRQRGGAGRPQGRRQRPQRTMAERHRPRVRPRRERQGPLQRHLAH
ncbi:MAG: hypothetical protein IPH08_03430 [Rhodocyclaceae bacterium]|nr:hypothetical protein [Rhodocyclaceae bacterium]